MWPFSHFQYAFKSSPSTADIVGVEFSGTGRAFERSVAIENVALDGFRRGLACWSSSETQVLSNFRLDFRSYFVLSL